MVGFRGAEHSSPVYGAALRGDVPAHLVKLKHGADDLTDFTRLTVGAPSAAGMSAGQVARHNRQVAQEEAAKRQRAAELAQGLREHKDSLAQLLETMMRKRAGLRWARLKAAHADGAYLDGCAMFNELEALRGTTGRAEETRDHDRIVERMRDEFLPNGCAVTEFTARWSASCATTSLTWSEASIHLKSSIALSSSSCRAAMLLRGARWCTSSQRTLAAVGWVIRNELLCAQPKSCTSRKIPPCASPPLRRLSPTRPSAGQRRRHYKQSYKRCSRLYRPRVLCGARRFRFGGADW